MSIDKNFLLVIISLLFSQCKFEIDPGIFTGNIPIQGTVLDMTSGMPVEGASMKIWFEDNSSDSIILHTDEAGFTALPGGARGAVGVRGSGFMTLGKCCSWWCTETSNDPSLVDPQKYGMVRTIFLTQLNFGSKMISNMLAIQSDGLNDKFLSLNFEKIQPIINVLFYQLWYQILKT
jgi:hypothetical protein